LPALFLALTAGAAPRPDRPATPVGARNGHLPSHGGPLAGGLHPHEPRREAARPERMGREL